MDSLMNNAPGASLLTMEMDLAILNTDDNRKDISIDSIKEEVLKEKPKHPIVAHEVDHLRQGDMFGELALEHKNSKRMSTI